jgi:hypothetical protein
MAVFLTTTPRPILQKHRRHPQHPILGKILPAHPGKVAVIVLPLVIGQFLFKALFCSVPADGYHPNVVGAHPPFSFFTHLLWKKVRLLFNYPAPPFDNGETYTNW